MVTFDLCLLYPCWFSVSPTWILMFSWVFWIVISTVYFNLLLVSLPLHLTEEPSSNKDLNGLWTYHLCASSSSSWIRGNVPLRITWGIFSTWHALHYPDCSLCLFYQTRLNELSKACLPVGGPQGMFASYVEWVLRICGSPFMVCEGEEGEHVSPAPSMEPEPEHETTTDS